MFRIQLNEKYLKSFFRVVSGVFVGGQKYSDWHRTYYELKQVALPPSPLLDDLEKESDKNKFLLFSEFIKIDQFSPHGYHAHHTNHAYQHPSHTSWAKALAKYCKDHEIKNVTDIGCGDGNLGALLVKEVQKINWSITWNGIELFSPMHETIRNNFRKHNVEKSLGKIGISLTDISPQKNTLLVFFYSLDSMAPEIFCNTKNSPGKPNTMIGVACNNGIIKEKYLSPKELEKKGIVLKEGIYTDASGKQYDLSSWELLPHQRLYLHMNAYNLLLDAVEKFPQPHVVIIDEFYALTLAKTTEHLGVANNLLTFDRVYPDTSEIYQQLGENLYYYPLFLSSTLHLLHAAGFEEITYDLEKRMAKILLGEKKVSNEVSYCTAIIAHNQKRPNKILPLTAPFA